MDWASNSWWIYLALAACVVILVVRFACPRRGGKPTEHEH